MSKVTLNVWNTPFNTGSAGALARNEREARKPAVNPEEAIRQGLRARRPRSQY